MILGYPFLIGTNPPMDWKKGKLYGTVAAFAPGHEAYSEGADQVCQQYESFIKQIDEDVVVKKTTLSTQLAIQVKCHSSKTRRQGLERHHTTSLSLL